MLQAQIIFGQTISRFSSLKDVFGFYSSNTEQTLQMSFGSRSIFRKNLDGKTVAAESGPTLLYSMGPTGHVAVMIYPCKSPLAKPFEDQIYLRVGQYSGYQLYKI